MIDQELHKEIIARLSTKKPLKVILLGSGDCGGLDEGSDVG
jgi:hypothetical protein